jgi:hypothetical protein
MLESFQLLTFGLQRRISKRALCVTTCDLRRPTSVSVRFEIPFPSVI